MCRGVDDHGTHMYFHGSVVCVHIKRRVRPHSVVYVHVTGGCVLFTVAGSQTEPDGWKIMRKSYKS